MTGTVIDPPSTGCGGASTQGGALLPRWYKPSSAISPLFTATLRSRYWPCRTKASVLPAPEDEEFQVPPLGKGDADRMVRRLTPLLEQGEIGARLDRGLAD